MSVVADALRPQWVHGLNDISRKPSGGLAAWTTAQGYAVSKQLQKKSCELYVADSNPLLQAYAYDCTRMAIAAFESLDGISRQPALPKSVAWLALRVYYSAFFAAHALLRMCGTSCTQLDAPEAVAVTSVASMFGMYNGTSLSCGLYKCTYDPPASILKCEAIGDSSHRGTWRIFREWLAEVALQVEQPCYPGMSKDNARVATLLRTICKHLCTSPATDGGWLSHLRNMINYRHMYSAWYPYADRPGYYEGLHDLVSKWKDDPITLTIWPSSDRHLQQFLETSLAIVAILRVMVVDMASRCSKGYSFHKYGAIAVLNRLAV